VAGTRRAVAGMAVAGSLAVAVACGSGASPSGKLRVVAAFYPLAWAARQVAPDADVEDLTPHGGEPHDLQLNARQRLDVQRAAFVFLLGRGFQPEVQRAANDARGRVVDLLAGLSLLPSKEQGIAADPHVWLDPVLMKKIVGEIAERMATADIPNGDGYRQRASALEQTLAALDDTYRSSLLRCSLKTIVTTHEAFGYIAEEYGLRQIGLTGVTPEAEPSAAAIGRVHDAARRGDVGAIFYEATDEGRRIGRSVASDVGLPALPLNTLESDPAPQNYVSQMQANLTSLRRGLRCS